MHTVRKSSLVVLPTAFALLLGIITPSVAQAASTYDTTYVSTPTLVITDASGQDQDITTSWPEYIKDSVYWANGQDYSAVAASFQTALSQGRLSVSEDDQRNVPRKVALVYWTEDTSLALGWGTANNGLTYVSIGSATGAKLCTATISSVGLESAGCDTSGYTQPATYGSNFNPVSYDSTPLGGSAVIKNLFVHTDQPNYPAGYAGASVPNSPPPATYVAMGDSFSSGEGNSPFEAGTDTSLDKCHRSSVAYPRLLDATLNLGATAFVACSGATTNEITNANATNNEQPQINALSDGTQVVTITIGGNDVDFKDYAIACTETLCGPGTFDYNYIMNAINASSFYNNLMATYESILAHALNAQVYVSGYPYMAAQTSDVCGFDDLTGTWAVENQLNAVISSAVNDVRAAISTGLPTTHLHYVDPTLSNSPFNGKYLCNGGISDFNGLNLTHQEYSFHPNAAGHQDFASVFESQMP